MRLGIRTKLLGIFFILSIFFLAATAGSYLNATTLRKMITRNSTFFEEYQLVASLDQLINDNRLMLLTYMNNVDPLQKQSLLKNWRQFQANLTLLNKSPAVLADERPWVIKTNQAALRINRNITSLISLEITSPEAARAAQLIADDSEKINHYLFKYNEAEKAEIAQAIGNSGGLARAERNLALSTVGMVVLWFSLTIFITQNITAPLSRLYKGVRQISHGNFDKRLSINTGDEIEDIAEAFNQMMDNLQEEEQAAAELQRRLLPPKKIRVQGIKLHAQQVQAKLVGGDWYDYYQSNNAISFLIADASGKGMSGALIATLAMSAIRSEVKTPATISMVLRKTNRTIEQRLGAGNFITLFYAHLELDTRELSYINCGHELPILYSAKESKWSLLECHSSLPLGISTEHFYPRKEHIHLDKGDRLLLYTDGLHDSRDAERRFFDMETILSWLNEHHDYAVDLAIDELLTKAVDFCDGLISDDITLLGIEIVADLPHPHNLSADFDGEKAEVV